MFTRLRHVMQAARRAAGRVLRPVLQPARKLWSWSFYFASHLILGFLQRRHWRALRDRVAAKLPEEYRTLLKSVKENHVDRTTQLLQAFNAGHDIVRSHRFAHVFNPQIQISFVYPYYEKKDTILTSINSILSQQPTLCQMSQVEIIVIDDGSEDTSVSTILPPQVMYVWRNKFNYGISRCRNLGAKIANGKYLVFVDPDLVFNPGYIDSILRGFQEFNDRTVFTGYLHDYHYDGCDDPRVAFGVWENPNIATDRFMCLAGGNMAIHRDLFMEVGGFDDDLIYGEVEDTLFGYQLSQRPDTKIVFSTHLSVRHIPHPPGLAHREPDASWAVCARKYPEAFRQIVIEGVR